MMKNIVIASYITAIILYSVFSRAEVDVYRAHFDFDLSLLTLQGTYNPECDNILKTPSLFESDRGDFHVSFNAASNSSERKECIFDMGTKKSFLISLDPRNLNLPLNESSLLRFETGLLVEVFAKQGLDKESTEDSIFGYVYIDNDNFYRLETDTDEFKNNILLLANLADLKDFEGKRVRIKGVFKESQSSMVYDPFESSLPTEQTPSFYVNQIMEL